MWKYLLLVLLVACTVVEELPETPIPEQPVTLAPQHNATVPVVAIYISNRSASLWDGERGLRFHEASTSLQVILASMGIPYEILSDVEIIRGGLRNEQGIKYPLVFSLNNPYVPEKAITEFQSYVASGGNLFFNADAFTNGNCFALDVPLTCKQEWVFTSNAKKTQQSPLTAHIPQGELFWAASHNVFLVEAQPERVLLSNFRGNKSGVLFATFPHGEGKYYYHSHLRPFWSMKEGYPGQINSIIMKKVIEESFATTQTPLVYLRPWGEYQAAFTSRYDVESDLVTLRTVFPQLVDLFVERNISGVFYILVDQVLSNYEYKETFFRAKNEKKIWDDAVEKGMVLGAHSTWHLGPDTGPNREYNIEHSLDVMEDILGERPDEWVSPNFLAQQHTSLSLVSSLNITTSGDQRLGFLPFHAVSPKTGERFSYIQLPTLEWYEEEDYLLTALEHHTPRSIKNVVDFYYKEGALINVYGHVKEENVPKTRILLDAVQEKESVWYAVPDELYAYWTLHEKIRLEDVTYNTSTLSFFVVNGNNRSVEKFMQIGNRTVPVNLSAYEQKEVVITADYDASE